MNCTERLNYDDILQHNLGKGRVRIRISKSNSAEEVESRSNKDEVVFPSKEKQDDDEHLMISNLEKPDESRIIGCEHVHTSDEEMDQDFEVDSDAYGGKELYKQSKRRKKLETTEEWKIHYEALTKFHKKFGHTNIPFGDLKHRVLYHWLGRQKLRVRQETLSQEQIEMLEKLGVDFRRSFDQKLEHISSVSDAMEADENFRKWIGKQLERWSRGKLPATKVRLLKKKGFSVMMKDQFKFKKNYSSSDYKRPNKYNWSFVYN